MVVSSTMDAESIGLVKDYVNELLLCVLALHHSFSHELTIYADSLRLSGIGYSLQSIKVRVYNIKISRGHSTCRIYSHPHEIHTSSGKKV
jgi:hypothetical protein